MDDRSVGGASLAGRSICSTSTGGTKVEVEYVEWNGGVHGGSVHKITAIGRSKDNRNYSVVVPRKIEAVESMQKKKEETKQVSWPIAPNHSYRLPPTPSRRKPNLEGTGKRRKEQGKRRSHQEKENNGTKRDAINTTIARLTEDRDFFNNTRSDMSTVSLSSKKGSTTSLNYAATSSNDRKLPPPKLEKQMDIIEFILPNQFRQKHLDTIVPTNFSYTSNLQNLDAIWISNRKNDDSGKVADEDSDNDSRSSRPFDCYTSEGSAEDLSSITGSHASVASDQVTALSSQSKNEANSSPQRQPVSIAYQAASVASSKRSSTIDSPNDTTQSTPYNFEAALEKSYGYASSGLSSSAATNLSQGHESSLASKNQATTVDSETTSVVSRAQGTIDTSQSQSDGSDKDAAWALPIILEKFRSLGTSIYDHSHREYAFNSDQGTMESDRLEEFKADDDGRTFGREVQEEDTSRVPNKNVGCYDKKQGDKEGCFFEDEPFDCQTTTAGTSTSTPLTTAPDQPEFAPSRHYEVLNPGAVWISGLGQQMEDDEEDETNTPDVEEGNGDIGSPLDCRESVTERSESDRTLVQAELAPDRDEEIEEAVRRRVNSAIRAVVLVEESIGDNSFDEDDHWYNEIKKKWLLGGFLFLLMAVILALSFGFDTGQVQFSASPLRSDAPSTSSAPTYRQPTTQPSQAPSPSPTSSPYPTSNTCDIGVDIKCKVQDDLFTNCDQSFPIDLTICKSRPSQISFLYRGTNCDSNPENTWPPINDYDCQDIAGGPEGYDSVFITVADFDRGSTYFEGFLEIGETFVANPHDFIVGEQMKINIYDPLKFKDRNEIVKEENLLQTIRLDNSCSMVWPECLDLPIEECSMLGINDLFGSLQVVEFINPVQGRVSNFVDVELMINIYIPEDSRGMDVARFVEGVASSNVFGSTNLTTSLLEKNPLEKMEIVSIPLNLMSDLTKYTRYALFVSIIAETLKGGEKEECFGEAFLEFSLGFLPPET